MARQRFSQSGFTLIELIAVIVIAAVLVVTFVPRVPASGAMTLTARAQQLQSDIRYAQAVSMTNGQRYCLRLTPSSPYSGYSLTTGASTCTTLIDHPGNFSQPVSLCNGTTCVTASGLTNGYVQFDSLGQPYVGPTTLLASNAVITLTEGTATQTVTIAPITGRVSVP